MPVTTDNYTTLLAMQADMRARRTPLEARARYIVRKGAGASGYPSLQDGLPEVVFKQHEVEVFIQDPSGERRSLTFPPAWLWMTDEAWLHELWKMLEAAAARRAKKKIKAEAEARAREITRLRALMASYPEEARAALREP